jgi:hypothetical protein
MRTSTDRSPLPKLLLLRVLALLMALTAGGAVAKAQSAATTVASGKLGAILFRTEIDRLFPTTVTVPPGRYLVQVDNGLISMPLTLALSASAGTYVSGKSMSAKATKGSFIITLPADTYTLSVQGVPRWTSQIVVQTK